MDSILIIIYIIVCIALITIVLLQSSKGEGLAGVFGGGGGSQAIFGARTGDILTKSTTGLAILFMVLSLILAVISGRRAKSLSQEIAEAAGRSRPQLPVGEELSPETLPVAEEAVPEGGPAAEEEAGQPQPAGSGESLPVVD